VSQRLFRLKLGVAVVFALLLGRLVQLQVIQGAELQRASEQNRIRRVREAAPRGVITDRAGKVLASNRPSYAVSMLPHPDPAVRREVEETLAPLLGMTVTDLEQRTKAGMSTGDTCLVAEDVDRATIARIEEHAPHLPGVSIEVKPVRWYPYAKLACHVLGYVREVDEADLRRLRSRGYLQGDRAGKDGIERLQESRLRGREGGRQVEVDAGGRLVRVLGRVEPSPGRPVALTLDLPTQQAAERGLTGKRGAVVALDPETGEVLALASSPGFDPNWFTRRLDPAHWRYLNSRARPQHDRAINGRYAPGSVFKVVVAAAGLEHGLVTPQSRFTCPGVYRLGRWSFHCWRLQGHGPLSFIQGIAQSCNVVFMTVGRRVGIARLADMARRFGLGRQTGIELSGESSGLVPDPDWKRERRHQPWYPGDTCQVAIGQGDLLVTPLQAAVEIAVVANGGYRVQPHLVRETGGRAVSVQREAVGLSAETIAALRTGLEMVVERGTGRSLEGIGVRVAGKTGTAENPHGKPHAWFIGYAPAEQPRIAVAVLVEGGGHGGSVSAPIAGEVIKAALRIGKPLGQGLPAPGRESGQGLPSRPT